MPTPSHLHRRLTPDELIVHRRAAAELRSLARDWLDRGNAFHDRGEDQAVHFCYGVSVTLDHCADRLETETTL